MMVELRRLRAENAALKQKMTLLGGHPMALVHLTDCIGDNARLRVLIEDVRTSLLAAGWRDDELLRRLEDALTFPSTHHGVPSPIANAPENVEAED